LDDCGSKDWEDRRVAVDYVNWTDLHPLPVGRGAVDSIGGYPVDPPAIGATHAQIEPSSSNGITVAFYIDDVLMLRYRFDQTRWVPAG
jgi:hypothetical protein